MTHISMKTHLHVLRLAAALCVGLGTANAAEKHDHADKATPKGGRLLDKTEPHAEFVVLHCLSVIWIFGHLFLCN